MARPRPLTYQVATPEGKAKVQAFSFAAAEEVDITYTGQTHSYHFANKKGGLTAALNSND